jgi:hypothetical protein
MFFSSVSAEDNLNKVNENFNDPLTAGSLARWINWNKTTLSASIADFKKRFNL